MGIPKIFGERRKSPPGPADTELAGPRAQDFIMHAQVANVGERHDLILFFRRDSIELRTSKLPLPSAESKRSKVIRSHVRKSRSNSIRSVCVVPDGRACLQYFFAIAPWLLL
jgi:hypothetical protein